jgi:signal transduction histidine kinase
MTRSVAVAEILSDVLERRSDNVPIELDVAAHPRVAVGPIALALAVDNLLDNAVRASPPGGLVQVRLASDGKSAVIEIVDQGDGPPPSLRARLFEPFSCGDGVGLAATEVIARAHGGRLEMQAPPTTFRLTLPSA